MTLHGPWWTWPLGLLAGLLGGFLFWWLLIGYATGWFWWNRKR